MQIRAGRRQPEARARVVVVGSQTIHTQNVKLPTIAFLSAKADLYPRNHPEHAGAIDACIGELFPFYETRGCPRAGQEINQALIRHGIVSRRKPIIGL
jgi:hypothetical protein